MLKILSRLTIYFFLKKNLNLLKKKIKKILSNFGFRFLPSDKDNFDNIYDNIYNKNSELVIFDVGANRGQSIIRFQNLFQNSKIFSFEPIKELFNDLVLKFENDKVKIFNFALNDKNEDKTFYITPNRGASSFYKINTNSNAVRELAPEYKIKPEEWIQEITKVKARKLDDIVKDLQISQIDILKIDTQGAEKLVLDGARDVLSEKKINIIELEINIGSLYGNNNSTFYDLETRLLKYGYKFLALDNNKRKAKNLIFNKDLEFDLLYVSDQFLQNLNQLKN